jgi:hypothetical protein
MGPRNSRLLIELDGVTKTYGKVAAPARVVGNVARRVDRTTRSQRERRGPPIFWRPGNVGGPKVPHTVLRGASQAASAR